MATKTATKKSATRGGASKKSASKKSAPAARKAATKKSAPKKAPARSANEDTSKLEELFVDSLKDIYWAEKHLLKALPKMQKAATSDELKMAIEDHIAVTGEQAARLEQVFEMMGKKAQAKKCEAMAGLTEEANSIVSETDKGTFTRDVGIIMAAQKVEHYEIATYGSLVTLARTLGQEDVAELLQVSLDEEKETDLNLSAIAEGNINKMAAGEDEEEEEEDEDEE
ncbi:MAG: ferritin-like domain-containing protein [Flavipsychrobacter sp.]|nr:ferritin-like domain-containing protein [Flavipsychrobacter sp.]